MPDERTEEQDEPDEVKEQPEVPGTAADREQADKERDKLGFDVPTRKRRWRS